jgi:hypothetical protein
LTPEDVWERLDFARRRKDELLALNGGDLPGADPHDRQQLVQEFFFHLVGAIEVLVQLVNEARDLALDVEAVSVPKVCWRLSEADVLRAPLAALYANTRRDPMPGDPYSTEGLVYRIWNYRHQVTHRRRQPFLFKIGLGMAIDFGQGLRGRWRELKHRLKPDPNTQAAGRSAHLIIDPREPVDERTGSMYSVPEELETMLQLVSAKCEAALEAI